jgi:hypothetical protein
MSMPGSAAGSASRPGGTNRSSSSDRWRVGSNGLAGSGLMCSASARYNRAGSMGFATWLTMPASRAFSRSCSMAFAVMAMTGIPANSRLARMMRVAS